MAPEINELVFKFLQKELTAEEEEFLQKWISASPANQALFEKWTSPVMMVQGVRKITAIDTEKGWNTLKAAGIVEQGHAVTSQHRVHFLRTAWFRYAVAVIILLGAGTYFWFSNIKTHQTIANDNKHTTTEILPGSSKAILTLADGSSIILDDSIKGNVASQGNTSIMKLGTGGLVYNAGIATQNDIAGKVLYNTISTPKGGQYQITLPDGSRVWLNAASSIKFPTAFTGTRNVEITGEVYMEIARDKVRPFRVAVNNMMIDVLGTSFNVDAYMDEKTINTTLLEGSVRIVAGTSTQNIISGQQARHYVSDHSIKVVKDADLNQVMAWKNGLFNFENASFSSVMRQLERWYDIRVKYEGPAPGIIFHGEMDRGVPLSVVLQFLAKMGIHSKLEGRTLAIN